MKKLFSLTLAFLLVLSLCACNASGGKETAGFRIGFGRANITPEDTGISLGGYQNDSERLSEGYVDYIYVSCLAITDANDNTVLLFATDMLYQSGVHTEAVNTLMNEKFGVPADRVIISASHTHSAPTVTSMDISFHTAFVTAAEQAFADQASAEIKISSKLVERMNFVRHYTTDTGIVVGDNFDNGGYAKLTGHTTESDKTLQVVQFVRADKKDIVLINWQAHPTLASTALASGGKSKNKYVSSVYLGPCRDYVEYELDCHSIFFLGASGNLNGYSRIRTENIDSDHKAYGENLAEQVLECLESGKTIETGTLKTVRNKYMAPSSSGVGDTQIELNAMSIGGLALATVPYEMFDTNGMTVKNNGLYDMTLMITMTNFYQNYVPADNAFDYPNCYEVRSCKFVRGTGEKVADELVKMLGDLKNN